jgi:predicted DNA-binding transcriptional regulator AlpA
MVNKNQQFNIGESRNKPSFLDLFEVLTSEELAERLRVPLSWVIEHSKKSKTSDPIPVFRLGKFRLHRWDSPEMEAWLERRSGDNNNAKLSQEKEESFYGSAR